MCEAAECLPVELTALSPQFPEFVEEDVGAICFNLRVGDAGVTPDPFFLWQGIYLELQFDGAPLNAFWNDKVEQFTNAAGAAQVHAFCSRYLQPGDRAFHNPAKARRWGSGVTCPASGRVPILENVLVRRRRAVDVEWLLCEVEPTEAGTVTQYALGVTALRCLTYTVLALALDATAEAADPIYGNLDPSEPCWVAGSTLIRRGNTGHVISSVPSCFSNERFVPIEVRDAFCQCVGDTATFAITGATLTRGSEFGSPLSAEVALSIGEELGKASKDIRLMASASMRGHSEVMAADHDFTAGFQRRSGCMAVHFKGSNMIRLHGNPWNMGHGTSYVLEEAPSDYSNHAKEACLMASSCHPCSIAICANGGPTVATNLVRFLYLCSPCRVFSICGMHGASGKSGAAASFPISMEQLQSYIQSLVELAPNYFSGKVEPNVGAICAVLQQRPVQLLDVTNNVCSPRSFHIAVEKPNETWSPGLTSDDEAKVVTYAKSCAACIMEAMRDLKQ